MDRQRLLNKPQPRVQKPKPSLDQRPDTVSALVCPSVVPPQFRRASLRLFSHADVLGLQQTLGNRAVQRMFVCRQNIIQRQVLTGRYQVKDYINVSIVYLGQEYTILNEDKFPKAPQGKTHNNMYLNGTEVFFKIDNGNAYILAGEELNRERSLETLNPIIERYERMMDIVARNAKRAARRHEARNPDKVPVGNNIDSTTYINSNRALGSYRFKYPYQNNENILPEGNYDEYEDETTHGDRLIRKNPNDGTYWFTRGGTHRTALWSYYDGKRWWRWDVDARNAIEYLWWRDETITEHDKLEKKDVKKLTTGAYSKYKGTTIDPMYQR